MTPICPNCLRPVRPDVKFCGYCGTSLIPAVAMEAGSTSVLPDEAVIETNPIPVKAALAMMGMIEEVYRLPMVPMKPENRAKLEKVLAAQELLPPQKA